MLKIERLDPRIVDVDHSKPLSLMHDDLSAIDRAYAAGNLYYMTLWLGKKCNLGCRYCATKANSTNDPTDLKPTEIKGLIAEFADLGGKVININGQGEPFLDRNLPEYIKLMHDSGVNLVITTNGTLINEEKARLLYRNRVALNIKLHSLDRDKHNWFVDRDFAYDATERGLRNLMSEGYAEFTTEETDEVITPISIMTLICKKAIPDLPDVWRLVRENDFYPMIDDLVVAGRACNPFWIEQIISDEENRALARQFKEIMGYKQESVRTNLCPASFGVFFASNGDLLADRNFFCCDALAEPSRYKYPDMSLEEVWNNLLVDRGRNTPSFDEDVSRHMQARNDGNHLPICFGMAATQARTKYINNGDCNKCNED